MNWKQRYKQVYDEYQFREYPSSSRDFGTLPPKYPLVKKHNGLRKFVTDFLKFSGHHSEIVNNIGRPVKKFIPRMNIFSGKVEYLESGIEWQRGSGKNGTADVHGHIKISGIKFPVPVYVEIKVGRDYQRPDQEKYENQVASSGALYWLVYSPEDFLEKYDELIKTERK